MRVIKRTIFSVVLLSVCIFGRAQEKAIKYYDGFWQEVTELKFLELKNTRAFLDLYYENDTLHYGVLVKRGNYGKLPLQTFNNLKTYISEISQSPLDTTKNIVINYISSLPTKKENRKPRSTWNIFDRDYLKILNEIADFQHYWINSPNSDNLKYYHSKKINWLPDKDQLFENIFFKHEIRYGNYILIKPNGYYFYYLGEYSKDEVWEKAKVFF